MRNINKILLKKKNSKLIIHKIKQNKKNKINKQKIKQKVIINPKIMNKKVKTFNLTKVKNSFKIKI